MLDVIAFDADDTLWESEVLYVRSQNGLERLLAKYGEPDQVQQTLYQTE